MPATVLSVTVRGRIDKNATYYLVRGEIASVAKSATSPFYAIKAPVTGELHGVRVASAGGSTDYDLMVGAKDSFTTGTVDEILKVITIGTSGYSEMDLGAIYSNTDATAPFPNEVDGYLYAYVVNNDAVNATGTITLELVIKVD